MSRIGSLPISIPEGVKVEYSPPKIVVEGPKGKLQMDLNFENFDGEIKISGHQIEVINHNPENKKSDAFHGLTRSLINNLVVGVHTGYSKTLKIVGVGYKAQLQGKTLVLNLGFSHPVNFPVPEGIDIQIPDPTTIIVSGIDKRLVGQVAANIRKFKPPEPYKGKGIMYQDERIRRKAGKAGVK
ncbi:MAG TPA: 50S ribosomal protein L6 [candidate division WOR-3 bacterium]|uniref:Large ribosomal subunit protein uL6 n=1 Tax=candidate division WOR-3 bacterium TaxID=2052148 RepID=A0A7C5DAP4_UNCW3|nr:50S ribosomal protein L6 [candidate division WOR-3 bacterium]